MKKPKHYHKFERPEMLKFLPCQINRSIEFGCADGLFSKIVKDEFKAECWGVDMNQASVLNAGRLLDKVICGDAMAIIDSLPEDYFDCLICNDFLEHLTFPDLFLEKMRKCMKEGAYLTASFPNVRSASNVFEFLIKKDWKYKDHGILDNTHFRFFTMKSLRRFLEENNFEIVSFQGIKQLSSKGFLFLLLDMMTLGYNHDMKYNGFGIRAIF